MKRPVYIDLFAGCGGLSLGLMNSGWKGLFAIEKSKDAFKTLKHNLIDKKHHFEWPTWLPIENHCIDKLIEEYRDKLEDLKGYIDLVTGGPPCQGFSSAGKRNEDDERNKLIDSFVEFVKIIRPNLLFFENVKGFTKGFKSNGTTGKIYSKYVWEKLKELGYSVCGEILDFSEFGIPQRRKRFILVGSLLGEAKQFFERLVERKVDFLKSKGLNLNVSMEDAISDLLQENGFIDSPDTKNFKAGIYPGIKSGYQKLMREGFNYTGLVADSHRFANHKKETREKFAYIIENAPRNEELGYLLREKYKINKRTVVLLDKNSVSPTLTTLPDDCIHYSEPRILTVREYARIQSFPDWFEFKAQYTTGNTARRKDVPRYTQVGNAVPPLFSEQCGLILKELIKNGRKSTIQS